MNRNSTEGPIIAVAAALERAEAIVAELARASLPAFATSDLGWALTEQPSVLFIDPQGWEGTCRTLLYGFAERRSTPPAVFLVAEDDQVLYEAGPVFDLLHEPLDAKDIRTRLDRALVLRRSFAQQWPRMLHMKRANDLARVEEILVSRTGLSIRQDRRDTFHEALQGRMVATLSPTVRDYERILTGNRAVREINLLACQVVVGETYFWRYSGQMHALQRLLKERAQDWRHKHGPLKIWCAGCSTGEEPYSVAMAAHNALGQDRECEVWGTDINPVALAAAERARYSERSLRNLPPTLRSAWLEPAGAGFRISDSLREMVRFQRMNLLSPEARDWADRHGPFDAIFCRNVTIYFAPKKSEQVVSLFSETLRPGGGLFLGSAESLLPHPALLTVVHEPGAFYYLRGEVDEVQAEVRPAPAVASAIDPEAASTFFAGLEALGREDFNGAEGVFRTLLDNNAQSPLGNTGMAILLANQGREVEARERLNAVVESPKVPVEAYFMLGLLDERAARPEDALASYNRALAVDDHFLMAHFNRAWIYKRMRKDAEFKAEMHRALALLRSSPHCPAWVTGGLSFESIVALMVEAIDGEGVGGNTGKKRGADGA